MSVKKPTRLFRDLGELLMEDLEQGYARPPYGVSDTYEVPHGRNGRNLSRDLMLHEQCAWGTELETDWKF
jgi:hypothetical protein